MGRSVAVNQRFFLFLFIFLKFRFMRHEPKGLFFFFLLDCFDVRLDLFSNFDSAELMSSEENCES